MHEARNIDKGDEGDIECVAEADKPCGLGRGIDIERPGPDRGLVGNDTHRSPANPGKSDHDIGRVTGLNFEKVGEIDN